METARRATDPIATGEVAGDAVADPPPAHSDLPTPPPPADEPALRGPPDAGGLIAADLAAMPVVAQSGATPSGPTMPVSAGLMYYAVFLPGPAGAPSGPPIYLPAAGAPFGAVGGGPPLGGMAAAPSPAMPAQSEAQAHNQRLLVWAIILCVLAVHLPWIAYLVAVHGCWGTFIDACWTPPVTEMVLEGDIDPFAETVGDPYLFARIVFLMLRVQSVLSADWAEYSQAMQLSTGLGSFVLTRIVASNGLLMESRGKAIYLAALCLTLFLILFWAELHLTSEQGHPLLGDDTVLDYISQTLPPDFASYGSVRDGLMQLLQFLRLADALILGACLALPTTQRKTA